MNNLRKLAGKLLLATWLVGGVLLGSSSASGAATQTLKLYFVHTGEKASITFKRDGNYDPRGLAQVNRFLRDWRKNEPAKMDPELLDLVWAVHKRSGSKEYIHVVSGYRSPETNNMLRGRSANTGVAKRSQHMLGKAMDFYIPGVSLSTLRTIGMQMQVGGVGFYPTSGSPFVHMDVGNVRAWPRMSRQELARIFPDGRTLHLPADGNPLPGYQQALTHVRQKLGVGVPGSTADNDLALPDLGNGLLTAMLPIPKTKAQAMIANQLAGPSDLDDELSLQAVPVPTLRPVQTTFEAVSAPSPGGSPAGTANFAQRAPHIFFAEPLVSIAFLPMHGTNIAPGRVFSGHRAFAAQSLRPARHVFGSGLETFEPRFLGESIVEPTLSGGSISAARSEQFDTGRFWSES